jgi:DNA-binding transcriptional LysR family regulator
VNIRFIETVVRLSELRSFRATADKLFISQAAISSRITAVEQEFGVKLFDRSTKDVTPTEEGVEFVHRAREILQQYYALKRYISAHGETAEAIRIGVVPAMALTILSGIVKSIRQQLINLQLTIYTDITPVLLEKLMNGELDVILSMANPKDLSIGKVDLCVFKMFWVSSPGIGIDPKAVLEEAELASFPIISYAPKTFSHTNILEYFKMLAPETLTLHSSNSLSTTIRMVADGIGISVVPAVAIQKELSEGTLQVIKTSRPFPPVQYTAVYQNTPHLRLPPRIASIAREVAVGLCKNFDSTIAWPG